MNETVEKIPGKVGTSIGYAVTFIMDYGSGRQVNISGCMPLNATKEDFNKELDLLRTVCDRQKALVMLRDTEAKLNAESKMCKALEHMLEAYEKEAEAEIKRLSEGDTAKHNAVKSQIANMRQQVLNNRQMRNDEIGRHKANIEIYEITIASIKKEVGE